MFTMPKILYRTILRELFLSFLLTLAFLNSILMMEKLLRISKLLAGVGASLFDIAWIMLLLQPQLMLLTIPMSLLLSTLLVYGRMNMDNEIIIMKATGMNFRKISFPVIVLGILCFCACISMSFSLGPKSSIQLRETIAKIITLRSTISVEEGTFNTSFKDIVIMVKEKKSRDTLGDIFIYDSRNEKEPKVLMAKEGRFFIQDGLNIGLYLQNGYINITRSTSTTEMFYDTYNMTLTLETESAAPKKIEYAPIQLLQDAEKADSYKKGASLYLEFHRRLSLPAVCLILIFMGTPLSLIAGKSGRLGGLAIGLLVFTVYYMLLIYGENLVMAGKAHHLIGAWTPCLLLGIVAFILFKREGSA
ncbi:MAG: permease, YjgP/YjgQ family [Nitrospirae bacterium]|nr:permease, YjgP/YjgQ family [Nitrospirota bacterium]